MSCGRSLDTLADVYIAQGRSAESEPLLRRYLTIAEKSPQATPEDLATALVRHRRLLDARNAVDRQAWRAAGFEVSTLGVGARHAAEHVRYASDSR